MTHAVYEMFWDCKYCGQKKLLGLTHRFCAGCGAPQDPSARYFPPDDEKVAVHDHVFVGADVTCPACRNPMSRAATCCTHCGSPLAKGATVALRAAPGEAPPQQAPAPYGQQPPYGQAPYGQAPYGQPAPYGQAPYGQRPPFAPAPIARAPKSKKPLVLAIVLGVFGFLFALFVVAIVWTRDANVVVTGHSWTRSIDVERYEPVRKSAWCDSMPIGAREISRHREERSTRQIPDGETCSTRKRDNGDGTYREERECRPKYRSESVYDDRCEYEIHEWRPTRTVTERGASLTDAPRWPVVKLAQTGVCVGCEREGARKETYTLELEDLEHKEAKSCTLPEARWATFAKGSRWKTKVRVMTGGVLCDEMQAL